MKKKKSVEKYVDYGCNKLLHFFLGSDLDAEFTFKSRTALNEFPEIKIKCLYDNSVIVSFRRKDE